MDVDSKLSRNQRKVLPEATDLEDSFHSSSDPEVLPQAKETEWTSIYVASAITFVGAVQFSIFFSSLWPYLLVIDETTNETFFGATISCYSIGQMLASPLFGLWSNRSVKMKRPLQAGLCLMFSGNMLYFVTQLLPFYRKYSILVARFLTGCGSANISLLKAYATSASTGSDRSKAIAYITGGLALGMVFGPAFQLIFTPIGPDGWVISENFKISMYTSPALAASLSNIFGMIMVVFFFKEAYVGVADKETIKKAGVKLPPYDKLALGLCFLTRFCQMFIVTNLESIGSPLTMVMFALTRTKVVQFTATAQAVIGFLAFSIYAMYIKFNLGRYMNTRRVTMIALSGLIVFHLCTYSWPFLNGRLVTFNDQDLEHANGTELVGCNTDKFDWCYSIKPVNFYVYYITYVFFVGTCFPNINIALNTIFSKIIGPRPQGTLQGWLQVAGSSARMIGPIAISALYTNYGPRWSWNLEIVLISTTLVLWLLLRKRMVPLVVPEEYAHFQDQNDPDVVRARKKSALKLSLDAQKV